VPSSAANENGHLDTTQSGNLYPPYFVNNHNVSVSQLSDSKPQLANGSVGGNLQSYSSPNEQNYSHNSQNASTLLGSESDYSAVQPSTPNLNGYNNKAGESDLATLLKSNGPYQPSTMNGIPSPHSTSGDSLNQKANSNSATTNTDHFLANTTTTMNHLSNLTTSMSTSTGKFHYSSKS